MNMQGITDKEFTQLAHYIRENYGIHLKEEKKTLVNGRLQHVLTQEGFSSFTEYFRHLISDKTGDAVTVLLNKITTNHTFFMREPDHFYYFRDKVLPWLASTVRSKDLRIWCAACSTGEESYTLAMILQDYFGHNLAGWDTKILATDISEKCLEFARRGEYSDERMAPLSKAWKLQYFQRASADSAVVIPKIKNEVIYRRFNLMDALFPFKKKFHVIFCRNVMIYFDQETKVELVNRLCHQLEDGGYLFIGHSESISRDHSRFRYIMPAVYQKLGP